ncbi:MAG: S8 family serine peptidase [Marinosulfonomonas sp.]|nr:S8 family serine peptidase [Marinosulfonomonas sp.]
MAVGLVAGCQSSDGDSASFGDPASVFSLSAGALSSFFVADWSVLETAAANLRTSDARYTIQNFSWSFDGVAPFFDSYSLDNANVEYAHAAGLTGVGQTIAIIDNGFLTTHDEFAGKTILMPTGGDAPGIDDHGTMVASVAAGSAGSGLIIGVAPGANLQLGSFVSGDAAMTAATLQAQAVGAIVQNNSWGYDIDATSSNLDLVFGTANGTDYLNALQSFSDNAVIVFAASNDAARTSADLMGALPSLIPALEPSWITTVNAVPSGSGENITSAALISSGCMQAAAWCISADGTVYGLSEPEIQIILWGPARPLQRRRFPARSRCLQKHFLPLRRKIYGRAFWHRPTMVFIRTAVTCSSERSTTALMKPSVMGFWT